MLYLLRLLIACLALASGGRVAEASAERGAAAVTIEAPGHSQATAAPVRRSSLREAITGVQVSFGRAWGPLSPARIFERLRTLASARLFLLHRALLR